MLTLLLVIIILSKSVFSQSLQLQYDLRHSIDPENNKSNYPSLFYEYFRNLENGALFTKIQSDFLGEHHNIGQLYLQIFGELKFWKPLIFLHLEYNGGLGIAEGTAYGYYINNAYLIGAQYPFQWGVDWQSASLCYRYNSFNEPSHDMQFSFYWTKMFWQDDFTFSGNFVLFTQNRDIGQPHTENLKGKKVVFWGQPQIWFNLTKDFSIGSQITLYYNIYSYSNSMLVYPAIAVKYRF